MIGSSVAPTVPLNPPAAGSSACGARAVPMPPTQEARPIALVRAAARHACLLLATRPRLGIAGGERQMRQEDRGLALGTRPAAEQQRIQLGQIFALDEELVEGRVPAIGRAARP